MEKINYRGSQPQIATAPTGSIRPGLGLDAPPGRKTVGKYERLIDKRGNIVPVTATYDENGALSLTGGHAAFSAYQNCGAGEIPVVIAETEGEGDALLLMLDIMGAQTTSHLAVSSCLCRLIDEFKIPRKQIAALLGKSMPWLSLAERVGRRLVPGVKGMLAHGAICMRSAEEISMLPAEVQAPFAEKAASQALNKEQVRQWVSLYTDKARDIMLNDPAAYLNAARKKKAPLTGYSLFCRAMQRCKAALRDLSGAIGAVPASAIDDVCGQIRELLDGVMELNDRIPEIFTRVNMGDGA